MVRALSQAGWEVDDVAGRDVPSGASSGVDFLVLAVPDAAVAAVASRVSPDPGCVVVHLSGALGPEVLAPHPRRAALHPLVALAGDDAHLRLAGAWMAVAGDRAVEDLANALSGRVLHVDAADRATYHAAAVVAANHLVALMGQVERIADQVGLPLEPFLDLAEGALAAVRAQGSEAALTGPVRRGDRATVEAHLAALEPDEREARLAGPAGQAVWPEPAGVAS
jgi:predicted short-subunit dehydrogenase-like oxidoreductase (DUF2520 family)